MKENNLKLIGVLILSTSIFIGSVWIGNSLLNFNKDTNVGQSLHSMTNSKALMTENETADYLNLSQDKFGSLLSYEEVQRRKLSSYDTYRFIPFVKIDGVRYFNKEQVDKWVEYNIMNRSEINTRER